jgi:tetratricopeptide (TPR) repeat protein
MLREGRSSRAATNGRRQKGTAETKETNKDKHMKRVWTLAAILAFTIPVLAQQAQPTQPAPQGATQPAPPDRRPKVKSKAEMDAYKAAIANQDPAALEKAADDFSAQFPDSELTPMIYREAMHGYEGQNNGGKLLETGQKLLKGDPDDPEALVVVSQVMAETPGSEADAAQRMDQAMKYAQHAIVSVDTDLPANLPPDKVDAFKSVIRSDAYSIVGTAQYNMKQYADAEGSFRKSLDALPSQPDAVVVLRLAMALEKQQKYPEALKEAKRAVDLTQENTGVGQMARNERDRLAQLAHGPAANPNSSAPKP